MLRSNLFFNLISVIIISTDSHFSKCIIQAHCFLRLCVCSSVAARFNSFPLHQVAALLNALSTVYSYKTKKAQAEQHMKHKEFLKKKEKQEAEKLKRQKEERKKVYRAMGQKEKKKLKASLKGASNDN